MKHFLALLLLCAALPVQAATYYIDFAAGSDSNSGTSKSSPWQRHPYMQSFGGSYSHTAGDQFIFKGGVTWRNACFTMQIMAGGTSGARDYYGVDKTWHSGGTWSQPIWDGEASEFPGGYDVMLLFSLANQPGYITVDNIDMRRLYWSGNKSYSWVAYVNLSQSANVTFANCYIHNWSHAALPTQDQLKVFIGANSSPFNPGCLLTNTVVDGESTANSTQGQSSGEATYAYSGNIINCQIRNMASGFIVTGSTTSAPSIIGGCEIGPLLMSYDSGAHPDGIFSNGGNLCYYHDNFIHDCHVMSIFTGEGGGSEDVYCWNNVVWNTSAAQPIEIDNYYTGARMWFWNNTLVGGSVAGVRVVTRGNGPLGVLDLRNNLIISDAGAVSFDSGATITHYTNANNVVLSVSAATAAGYAVANRFQPTSASNPTVGAGVDMSALLSGALADDVLGVARDPVLWDAGAYQFSSPLIPAGTITSLAGPIAFLGPVSIGQ